MFTGSQYTYQGTEETSSSVIKQSVAWNTIDPGDAYDIKKYLHILM